MKNESRFLWTIPALCFLLVAFGVPGIKLATAIAGSDPQSDGIVIVLVSPFADAETVVEQAGGRLIGTSRAFLGVLATRDDGGRAIEGQGIWASFSPGRLAGICGFRT